MKKKAEHIALIGLLGALALVLGILENLLPPLPGMPPGAKAGLSNLVTMFAAGAIGLPAALFIAAIKGLFAFLTRGVSAGLMSLCGGLTVEKNKIHAGLHRCLRCVRAQPRTAARCAMADRFRRAGVYSRARAVFGRLRYLYRAFAAGFTPAVGEAAGFEKIEKKDGNAALRETPILAKRTGVF